MLDTNGGMSIIGTDLYRDAELLIKLNNKRMLKSPDEGNVHADLFCFPDREAKTHLLAFNMMTGLLQDLQGSFYMLLFDEQIISRIGSNRQDTDLRLG